ncbi:MAG: amidohydrolase family protein [Candidatus Omnitrophota bacterium]
MIYDAHIHYIPPSIAQHTTFYKGPWSDLSRLRDYLDRYGINKALIIYPSTDAGAGLGTKKEADLYNSQIEKLIGEDKRIIAAGLVDWQRPDNEVLSQVKDLKERGFCGISIASGYDGRFVTREMFPLFAAAEKHDMVVSVHPQTINPVGFERVRDPLLMPVLEYSFDISLCLGLFMTEGVFERFPRAKILFSSLGGVTAFLKERFDRIYTMLRGRNMARDLGKMPSEILKMACVDTCGAPISAIEQACALFGKENVLWGSDYPAGSDISANIRSLDNLGQETKAKVRGENFSRLFSTT